MQGYTTMAFEAYQQLAASGAGNPTHIFLQAGVGSMAAAMAGFFAQTYGDVSPKIVIVEPNKADCLFRTARANDGKLHFVTEDMNTIMAGLACGEPSTILFPPKACGSWQTQWLQIRKSSPAKAVPLASAFSAS